MELNKLYLGDFRGLMPAKVADKSVDIIFADLPYETTNCSWDKKVPLNDYIVVKKGKKEVVMYEKDYILHRAFNSYDSVFIIREEFQQNKKLGLWAHYDRVLKDDGVILLYAQTPFDKELGESVKDSGTKIKLRYEWIWEKTQATGHLNAKKAPMKAHENILVFYKNLPTYNPQKTSGHKPVNSYTKSIKEGTADGEVYGKTKVVSGGGNTDRYPRSIVTFASDKQKSKLHSTQKPIALTKYMLQTYGEKGAVVLDNTAGSGTVGVGCIELDMNYIMMEKSEVEYLKAKNRLDEIERTIPERKELND